MIKIESELEMKVRVNKLEMRMILNRLVMIKVVNKLRVIVNMIIDRLDKRTNQGNKY
jgi:hypothetical protein